MHARALTTGVCLSAVVGIQFGAWVLVQCVVPARSNWLCQSQLYASPGYLLAQHAAAQSTSTWVS